MVCDYCGNNEAVFHSKTNINGKVTEVNLCENCLNKSEYKNFNNSFFEDDIFEDNSFFSNNSLLGSFFANNQPNLIENEVCKNCGCTFQEFSKTGLLGCENCYSAFKNKLSGAISNMQMGTTHLGKVYAKTNDEQLNKTKINQENVDNNKVLELKKQLKEAVEVENYELASKLKKEILKLEGEHDN